MLQESLSDAAAVFAEAIEELEAELRELDDAEHGDPDPQPQHAAQIRHELHQLQRKQEPVRQANAGAMSRGGGEVAPSPPCNWNVMRHDGTSHKGHPGRDAKNHVVLMSPEGKFRKQDRNLDFRGRACVLSRSASNSSD